jgi:hypothetical protein
MYQFFEAERAGYMIRLPASRVLQDRMGYLLKRPVGRPPHEVRRPWPASGCPCASQPVFAAAGGALVGMMLNFTLSRQVVFRSS